MTKVDRYILMLYVRTVFICFCSIAGIFIVFHAFTAMDDFVELGQERDGLVAVMLRFYGPYMLLLFDMTGTIIGLLALLFVVGWLRRTGELTALLAAGISHGRIFRPMIIAALVLVTVQLANRELVLPDLRDQLSMKAKNITGIAEEPILAQEDKPSGILFDGKSIQPKKRLITDPNFRLYGDYPGYGDMLMAKSATWHEATPQRPSGYLLDGVRRPENIDQLPSLGTPNRPILFSSYDQPWLERHQCFVATTVSADLLQEQGAVRRCSVQQLATLVKNPAVRVSPSLKVLLHERVVRVPLDFALILLGLPLVVNRRQRNLFLMVGVAIATVMFFFALKTFASFIGGSEIMEPALAAWLPLIVIGPIAYVRYREVQTL